MKDFIKTVICFAIVIGGGMFVKESRETMPKTGPSFGNVAYQEDVNVFRRTVYGSALSMTTWDVEDYFLFKIARLRGSKETWLATTILSNGKWHK